MTTMFTTRQPNAIDRIKGFLFRLWFKPYASIRKSFNSLYIFFFINAKKRIEL